MSNAPTCELSQEMRFAVVMYGGVSLAIYINGVSQELLRLVRATAPVGTDAQGRTLMLPDDELTSTEKVYRTLGRMLTRNPAARLNASQVQGLLPNGEPHPVRTRFVIDVISGTSAGGINGIFLAKALANSQEIQQLEELWVQEGDIALLLNDRASVPPGLTPQDPPRSLLNSQRMYLKLLEAFNGMDREKQTVQPLCALEIDLFVPTTDIEGLTMPLRLADKLVDERRHRNVFHFKCVRDEQGTAIRNDFQSASNPFLAFAARCSSSFPFAFEPMQLADVDAVLPRFDGHRKNDSTSDVWKPFYSDYERAEEQGRASTPFPRRSFGDGGYLDNKPFSYAAGALLQRQADVPVDRKLLYVEPSPEHPEDKGSRKTPGEKPNVLENVTAALLTLPRYETIREDLERVLERNRQIERVQRISQGLDEDVRKARRPRPHQPIPGKKWAKLDLQGMIALHGVAYGSYHRLKVADATDELARLVASVAGFDLDSDDLLAIQYVVRAWRIDRYITYFPQPGKPRSNRSERPTLNRFLIDFDLNYRIRRLNLVRTKLDVIACMDQSAWDLLRSIEMDTGAIALHQEAFVRRLHGIKAGLNRAFEVLRRTRRTLWARSPSNPISDLIRGMSIGPDDLRDVLKAPTDDARLDQARQLLQGVRADQLQEISATLAHLFRKAMKESSEQCMGLLDPAQMSLPPEPADDLGRRSLWHYYWDFDSYDMVTFPVLHSLQAGELATVDIFRISPEDATSIIDERHTGRHKLAGAAVGHFGAFLDRVWRQNDIFWGRLDGAERIITALLPRDTDKVEREKLVEEAHLAIIRDFVKPTERAVLSQILARAIAENPSKSPSETRLRELVKKTFSGPLDKEIDRVLTACLNERDYLSYLKNDFEVDRALNPRRTVESLSRATRVTGGILEQMAEQYGLEHSPVAWVSRLGQIFWGLVMVSVPGSLQELILLHWLRLLYLFEALLIVGGTLVSDAVQDFGWNALKLTLAVHVAVSLLRDFMRGTSLGARIARVALVVATVAAGGVLLYEVQRWVPPVLGRLSLELQQARDLYVSRLHGKSVSGDFAAVAPLWARLTGGAALLAAAGVGIAGAVLGRRHAGKKVKMPLLELELVESADEARNLLADAGRDRLRLAVALDYGVIAVYTAILLFLSRLLAGAGFPGASWLGLAAGVCTVAGACLDVLENFSTRKLLAAEPDEVTTTALDEIRTATGGKWALLSIASGLLVALFLVKPGIFSLIAAACFGLASLIGIAALLSRRWRFFQWALPLMASGLLVATLILLFAPKLLPGVAP
jgi:patatin-related protein